MSAIHAIQQDDRVLASLTAEDPANLPRDLTMLVQLNLNVESVIALGRTTRRWANLTEDPQLWRDLLERDFGKKCSENVPDQDCKLKYKQLKASKAGHDLGIGLAALFQEAVAKATSAVLDFLMVGNWNL